MVQSIVNWDYHLLSSNLIVDLPSSGLSALQTSPQLSSSSPCSLTPMHSQVLSNWELNPTQHLLTTQATTRWSKLEPWLGESSHLRVCLERHVIHLSVHWNFAPLYPGVQKNLRITILIWNSSCKSISRLNLGRWDKFVDVCCHCHTEPDQKSSTKCNQKSQDITYARGFTSKIHYTNWSSNPRPWRPTITHFALQLTILLALGWLFQRTNGNARKRPWFSMFRFLCML